MHTVYSIRAMHRIQSGTITPSQGGPERNGNEGALHILQISKAGTSLSDAYIVLSKTQIKLVRKFPCALFTITVHVQLYNDNVIFFD